MRRVALVTALAALALVTLPGHAATRPEPYVAGSLGDVQGACKQNPLNPSGLNIGAVCFDKPANTTVVGFSIKDLHEQAVGAFYSFGRKEDTLVDDLLTFAQNPLGCGNKCGFICKSLPSRTWPSGTNRLTVMLDGLVYGPQDCLLSGTRDSLGFATNGTVTFTYS